MGAGDAYGTTSRRHASLLFAGSDESDAVHVDIGVLRLRALQQGHRLLQKRGLADPDDEDDAHREERALCAAKARATALAAALGAVDNEARWAVVELGAVLEDHG